jgi:hypothetical protein
LYLSWWDNFDECVVCLKELEYMYHESVSQKWCSRCIIIYTGCRYCLTTNVIFGITNRSQCINCKRTSFINIDNTNISSENCTIDDSLLIFKKSDANLKLLRIIRKYYSNKVKCLIEWIPHSQFKDLRKIAEGGFSEIYKATWLDGIKNTDVALKKLLNSQNFNKYFFNEVILKLKYFAMCTANIYLCIYTLDKITLSMYRSNSLSWYYTRPCNKRLYVDNGLCKWRKFA